MTEEDDSSSRRNEAMITFLFRRWAGGESIVPAVELLVELGREEEAAAIGRLALADPHCLDRPRLDELLLQIGQVGQSWISALDQVVADPRPEQFERLVRFTPPELLYQRLRLAVPLLRRRGCDPDALFRIAAPQGMTPDLIELAQSGEVSPETIERHAESSAAAAGWLGLAAEAAHARGDRLGTVRLLRKACSDPDHGSLAFASIHNIRKMADADLNADLSRAGVPESIIGDRD
jgi:hypothetical protein